MQWWTVTKLSSFSAIKGIFQLSFFSMLYGRRSYYTSSGTVQWSESKHGEEEAETSNYVCKQMNM